MNRINTQESCALCGFDEKLRKSHIVPKLVYKRMKSQKKSRFRELENPKNIMSDGDKVSMLCSKCELFMSKFETFFANHFFDNYLKGNEIKCLEDKRLIDLIAIISWRVIYDDLYLHDSLSKFEDIHKSNFILMEKALKEYLLNLKSDDNYPFPDEILAELFDLSYLGFTEETISSFDQYIFGYIFFDNISGLYSIITHFSGLVLLARFKPKNYIYINEGDIQEDDFPHYSIQQELIEQFKVIMKQKAQSKEILDNGLRTKIEDYLKE